MNPGASGDSLTSEVLKMVAAGTRPRFRKQPIREETSLSGDLGMDSLGKVALLVRLEEAFALEVDETEIDLGQIQTVRDVLNTVRRVMDSTRAKRAAAGA